MLAGRYRSLHGPGTLGQGSQFVVKWQNGSSERYMVTNRLLTAGTTPVPGTQQPAGSSAGGGGYVGDPGSGHGDPYADCTPGSERGCVAVGGGPMVCETVSVLECPGMG